MSQLPHLLNASAFFLLIEDEASIPSAIHHLKALLDRCLPFVPPVVVLDATDAGDDVEMMETSLKAQEHEALSSLAVSIIPIKEHVVAFSTCLYWKLHEGWKMDIARYFLPEPEIVIPQVRVGEMDPVMQAMRSVQSRVCLRTKSNIGPHVETLTRQEMENMMSDWRQEWNIVSSYTRVTGNDWHL